MNKKFYEVYQYIAFLVIFPCSLFIWYKSFGSLKYAVFALSLPVITAYIVPAIGTNVTKLWEFNNKQFMIGKFRAYHGFVLGSFTALFEFIFYKLFNISSSFVFAIFFALINYLYDAYAIKNGFMIVYNRPAFEGKNAFLIAADYALIYFFMFGLIYSLYIKGIETELDILYIGLMHIASLFVPTLVYAVFSKLKNGVWGIAKYEVKSE